MREGGVVKKSLWSNTRKAVTRSVQENKTARLERCPPNAGVPFTWVAWKLLPGKGRNTLAKGLLGRIAPWSRLWLVTLGTLR